MLKEEAIPEPIQFIILTDDQVKQACIIAKKIVNDNLTDKARQAIAVVLHRAGL